MSILRWTGCVIFDLPVSVDRSKKFLREDNLAHPLYQPTKFQPARPSHLQVYKEGTNTLLSDTLRLASLALGVISQSSLCVTY